MNIVETIVTPIAISVMTVGMIGWGIFLIYWAFVRLFPNFKLWLKYSIFRKQWSEKDVEWCMKAIAKGWDVYRVERFLLLNGMGFKRIKELKYIFLKVKKLSKGGGKEDEQFRQSNEQTEIPEI